MTLVDQLIRHEGLMLKPYRDSMGILTIGVGRNLDDVGITRDEAIMMLNHDIDTARADLARVFPWTQNLDPVRLDALTNMVFNLGIGRLRGFARMLLALQAGDWNEAAQQALDSKWAVQVGNRSKELAQQFITGKYA